MLNFLANCRKHPPDPAKRAISRRDPRNFSQNRELFVSARRLRERKSPIFRDFPKNGTFFLL
jgi:hypothetical protein